MAYKHISTLLLEGAVGNEARSLTAVAERGNRAGNGCCKEFANKLAQKTLSCPKVKFSTRVFPLPGGLEMTLADRCHWSLHLFSGRAESPQAAGWSWWAAAWRKHPWSISRKLWPCFTLPIFQFVQTTKPWHFILGNRFNCLKCKLGPGNSINRQGFLFGSVMHSHFKSFLIDLYVLGVTALWEDRLIPH